MHDDVPSNSPCPVWHSVGHDRDARGRDLLLIDLDHLILIPICYVIRGSEHEHWPCTCMHILLLLWITLIIFLLDITDV